MQIGTLCQLVHKIKGRHAMYHTQDIPYIYNEVEPLQWSGIQLLTKFLFKIESSKQLIKNGELRIQRTISPELIKKT
jgi:hypothetical protein